ncbi:sugar phosphate isomerase/epimerase family protein [Dethiosulfatarculus sandiegensis]|uniref:Xylose isomerase-like TIM barrel domain-containing protein n=1 Tax=Dethiosulfatarculus sandiegensis TaxID=1429043 RepID=A0A0D2J044_9BACT|nr:TIM barrel protein [Dethiosulfatarculus sandiegensis]KIX11594.1 hypothetical protein X474_24940 [Dethiosulfatarculus sandiegensis]
MNPSIGITSQIIHQAKWYKHIGKLGFDTIEINRQNSKLHFNLFFLEKVKRYMEGVDLSIHSGTKGIFQPNESFTKANLAILTAELDICRYLGAGQFVFHLNDGFCSAYNKKRLKEVITYSLDSGVQMLFESNSVLVAEHAYDILDSFPELGYVLDLGHLNNGHGQGKLGCSMESFISRIRDRVVYVHASNNCGKRDEHNGLEEGTLDWRHILDLLDLERVLKIIIEVRHAPMVTRTTMDLMHYLEGDLSRQRRRALG